MRAHLVSWFNNYTGMTPMAHISSWMTDLNILFLLVCSSFALSEYRFLQILTFMGHSDGFAYCTEYLGGLC
jgi:hypothetical protein